jgi:hypothetical protein
MPGRWRAEVGVIRLGGALHAHSAGGRCGPGETRSRLWFLIANPRSCFCSAHVGPVDIVDCQSPLTTLKRDLLIRDLCHEIALNGSKSLMLPNTLRRSLEGINADAQFIRLRVLDGQRMGS